MVSVVTVGTKHQFILFYLNSGIIILSNMRLFEYIKVNTVNLI